MNTGPITNVIKKVSFPSTTPHNIRSGSPKFYQETSKGTRTVQADSDSDSDAESRRLSPHRLPAGWDHKVKADYRR